jgi:hypothetical protein
MPFRKMMPFLASLTRMRWIMALAAVTAILLWGAREVSQMLKLSARYQKMALYCGKSEATYLRYCDQYLSELRDFDIKKINRDSLTFIALSPPGRERGFAEKGVALNRESADHWRRLKRFYGRVSRFPWISVPEDLQHPRWEDELDPHPDGAW